MAGVQSLTPRYRVIVLALILYAIWVLATWLLEGRLLTLLRPEAVTDRIVYTVVANMVIGIVLALWVVRQGISSKLVTRESTGFRTLKRTIPAVLIGFILGFLLFLLQNPPPLDPIVLLNVYAQVFTVTVAEVAICWGLIGADVEGTRGRIGGIGGGIILAAVFFGFYHIAHSPPFNQPLMMVFLALVGVLTGLVYFIGRDIYATMAFHNFLGITGVLGTLNAAGGLETYRTPIMPYIAMAVISLVLFVVADVFLIRRQHGTS